MNQIEFWFLKKIKIIFGSPHKVPQTDFSRCSGWWIAMEYGFLLQATTAWAALRSFPPTWRWISTQGPHWWNHMWGPGKGSRAARAQKRAMYPHLVTRQAQEVPIHSPATRNTHVKIEHGYCLSLLFIDLPETQTCLHFVKRSTIPSNT